MRALCNRVHNAYTEITGDQRRDSAFHERQVIVENGCGHELDLRIRIGADMRAIAAQP